MSESLTRSRASPDKARDWLDNMTANPATGTVPVSDACGCVLRGDLFAEANLPPTHIAATNGYALQARASAGASEYNPLPLRLRSGAEAGPVGPDEAVAVISGDTIPDGADTVVTCDEAELRNDGLELYHPLAEGQYVVHAGAEVTDGQRVFASGHQLRPEDLNLLSQLGLTRLDVVRRPRVRLLMVAAPERDANGIMLEALLKRDGAASIATLHTPDHAALRNALTEADCELILICGGSGDGANDFSAAALAEAGELEFHGIAMSPGETTALGRTANAPVALLPGAPLPCLYAYEWFAGRAVRRLAGQSGDWPYGLRRARLSRKVASSLGRLEFCRVQIRGDLAHPSAIAEQRLLSSAVRADGFVPVPHTSEGWPEATEVIVWMQTPFPSQE